MTEEQKALNFKKKFCKTNKFTKSSMENQNTFINLDTLKIY